MATVWDKKGRRSIIRIFLAAAFMVFFASVSFSENTESRLDMLEEALKSQQKKIEEQRQLIERLKEEVAARRQAPEKTAANDRTEPARPAGETQGRNGETVTISGAVSDFYKNLKNPAMTFVLNSFYYGSSVNERQLKNRGITGFSATGLDQKKGFNIDEFSVAAFAPVDEYFDLFGVVLLQGRRLKHRRGLFQHQEPSGQSPAEGRKIQEPVQYPQRNASA